MAEDESILPENDSVFDVSARVDNLSSDALIADTSFESYSKDVISSSTPAKGRSKRQSRKASEDLQSKQKVSGVTSPSRRVTRSQSPSIASPSRPMTRSQSPSVGSPSRPMTRSQSPCTSSRPVTRSQSPSPASTSGTGSKSRSPSAKTQCRPPAGSLLSRPVAIPLVQKNTATTTKATKYRCPKCPSLLANKHTLDAHLRGHLMKGILSKAPSKQELGEAVSNMVIETLNDICKEMVIGDLSAAVNEYATNLRQSLNADCVGLKDELINVLCESFSKIMSGKKALFPSHIRSSFYIGTNVLLSSNEFKLELKTALLSLQECEERVLNCFLGNFMLVLSSRVLVCIIRQVRNAMMQGVTQRKSSDRIENLSFKQLSYYIGGSIVHGYMWKGRKYREKSKAWAAYCDVLQEKFILTGSQDQCSSEVREFCEKRDRGGLTHITDCAFSFFLMTFDLLMSLESDCGSLPPSVTDKHILTNDVILLLWDQLTGNDLDQDQSLDLLIQLSESCKKVVMKGILKRRLNEQLQAAYNSVPLRHLLA